MSYQGSTSSHQSSTVENQLSEGNFNFYFFFGEQYLIIDKYVHFTF